uniref:Uncharacterized protein n=1 Tax=Fagus sylvatica TaxID=28930 RepID=A0A2N9GE62_FAGSY
MEGAPNDGTSADPAMTPIERQMQVIATSIQDLARETSRQNQELWQAIRKGPQNPHDNNQPPPRGGNGSNDQEADSHQVTRRRGDEIERTPPRSRHRAESAGSSAPPSQHKTAKTTRSSKQPERPGKSSKLPERQDRRDNSSRQPDHPAQSSRDPDDKTARLEKELREMRKQMGDMKNSLRAKAARNLDNLVHRADSPFIPSIADFPLPSRFKVPLLENFDGTKDPFDYLEAFKTIMQLQAVPEEVMCRAFPLGLRGSARVWFNKLESESIGSFVQLSRAFIDHFIGSQRRGRPPTHLLSVKQMEGESLRAFVHRFNEEAMKDRSSKRRRHCDSLHGRSAKRGLPLRALQGPPRDNVGTYVRSHETHERRRRPRGYGTTHHQKGVRKLKIANLNPPSKRSRNSPRPLERKRTTAPPVKFSSFTPLNTPIDKLLLQIQDDPSLRWPGKIRSDPNSRPKNLYCRSMSIVQRIPVQQSLQHRGNRPNHNRPGPVGEIRTIVGGPASGGTSRASRKAYARQVHNIMVVQRPPKNIRLDDQIISFSEEDARGTHQPHDDALVITINIAGFTTRRVMVDNGSSADILYLPAYQQMRLDKDKLRPMDAPLVGFTGDKVCPVGIVTLPITVGTHPKTVSKTVDFLVVNCPSAYNAIIGDQPYDSDDLHNNRTTNPQPTPSQGDQVAARECYLASLGPGGQNQTMTIEEQKILVKPSGELDTIELEDGRPERTTKIGTDLPPTMKESLVQFLKENKDKRRVFAPERNNAIMEEVDKLLAANFIREVFYPDWLANVVMVKKSTGKWRMCVDFTDLNKACPKDSFPLPRIDQLVDSTAGHKLLTFMDAFSGYNQIVMDECDQEKTSFITSRGLFCYKVMPFGLKNAGATYQRLMNRMFHDQIGRNVEVYVDDMLVKSKEEDGHLDDLRETFQTLRKYQMKLNPSKCAFGVYSGKFLGFMVSQRGIEANPDKIKAILEMRPPKNTKEVQRLTGRVAALNRFMSRSTDKCLPFFKILKKAFEWNDECQQAFEELKKYLTEPPLLSPSKRGEELYLYLAVSPTAVSSVLIREEERRQLPVYYTSRALRGAEERYPPMEKLAFTLVTAARKLRPYFQAHTIVLLTNHPLRKAMNKPDAAGRLIQWSIELSEFDIDYRPRTAIKVQALADFITEFTSKDDEPTEDYPTTNNEAEYEALLTGLEMAKVLGATELEVLSDSQLVVGQVNGDYEAKEGRMQQADQLAKSASSSTSDDKIKVVQQSSLQTTEMNPVHAETSWMTPIISYLQRGTLPDNLTRSQTIKDEANYVLREIHEGVCGNHSGARALQRKVVRAGYYWPSMQADASRFVQHCDKCQRFANLVHSPPEALVPITAPWPFAQWGLDIMGPFPIGRRQLKFLVVAIDYFTKWVEAEPLATITEKNVQNFVWKAVICRFGIPRVLVSDNGKQFDNPRFRQFSQELGIHNHYSSPGHPQANGQVEVTNRSLLKLIKTRLEGAKGLWPEELASILWAYRTTIDMTTLRTSAYDDQQNEEQLRLNLDLIDEVRETAETRMKRYQEKMARHYNSRVKPRQLTVGDFVLQKVTLATKNPSEGKLGPNWEGPYKVIEIRRPGTYHLEDMDGRRLPHPWNAEHLRKYYP